jgi:hypothetical protein
MPDWRRDGPRNIALGRVAFGLALMIAPGLAGRVFLGREASRPSVRFMSRIFGGRDLAIGLLQLQAVRQDRPEVLSKALWLGAGCDAWDAVAAWRGGELPLWGRVVVAGLGSTTAAMGVAAAVVPRPGPAPAPSAAPAA